MKINEIEFGIKLPRQQRISKYDLLIKQAERLDKNASFTIELDSEKNENINSIKHAVYKGTPGKSFAYRVERENVIRIFRIK